MLLPYYYSVSKKQFLIIFLIIDLNVVGLVWGYQILAYGPGDSTLDHTPNEHLALDEYEHSIWVLRGALVEAGWAS